MIKVSLKTILENIGLDLELNERLLSINFELENMFDTYDVFDNEKKWYKCYYSGDPSRFIRIYDEPVEGIALSLLYAPYEGAPAVGRGYSEAGLLCRRY